MTSTAFSDVVYKFNTPTTAGAVPTITTTNLFQNTHTDIGFNLQIVEKGDQAASSTNFASSSVGSAATQIDDDVSQDLANIITAVLVDRSILTINLSSTSTGPNPGRNIRSMKLIINVDPFA